MGSSRHRYDNRRADPKQQTQRTQYLRALRQWASDPAGFGGAHPMPKPNSGVRMPGWLNNGMIAPLAPYRIAGVIWYQGESNVGEAQHYKKIFAAMIDDWRGEFHQPGLPFYFVQIAPYTYGDPDGIKAAELREAQRRVMNEREHTGMVVTTDLAGDGSDIHPRNKTDVGHRLARWALADVYGMDLVRHGPHPASVKINANKAVVTFDLDGGEMDTSPQTLPGFQLADSDGTFQEATAKFGPAPNQVTLTSDVVDQPTAVRYAFKDNPRGLNLKNTEGLPATPFELTVE